MLLERPIVFGRELPVPSRGRDFLSRPLRPFWRFCRKCGRQLRPWAREARPPTRAMGLGVRMPGMFDTGGMIVDGGGGGYRVGAAAEPCGCCGSGSMLGGLCTPCANGQSPTSALVTFSGLTYASCTDYGFDDACWSDIAGSAGNIFRTVVGTLGTYCVPLSYTGGGGICAFSGLIAIAPYTINWASDLGFVGGRYQSTCTEQCRGCPTGGTSCGFLKIIVSQLFVGGPLTWFIQASACNTCNNGDVATLFVGSSNGGCEGSFSISNSNTSALGPSPNPGWVGTEGSVTVTPRYSAC